MSNQLYQMYGQTQQPQQPQQPQQQSVPQQQNVMADLANFMNGFKGDPKAQVMSMLNSGQVSQAEYNQAVQQANQLYSMMNRR